MISFVKRRLATDLLALWMLAGLIVAAPQKTAAQTDGLKAARALQEAFVESIDQTEEAVVAIARVKNAPQRRAATDPNPFALPGVQQDRRPETHNPEHPHFVPNAFGTGIILAPEEHPDERIILTTYHVVQGGPPVGEPASQSDYRLYVRLANRQAYPAHIRAADPRSDLAVLQIDPDNDFTPSQWKPIPLGDASDIQKGQLVLTLGNPYAVGRDGSASAGWGMISNIARRPAPGGPPYAAQEETGETIHRFGTLLQVDARLNLGTSGGALLGLDGQLIGITTSMAALEGYEKSLGYGIPLNEATRRVIRSLIKGYEVEYGFLGIAPDTITAPKLQNLSGSFRQPSAAVALRVFPNSPAQSDGLRQGDVILEVNGTPIYDRYDLMREIGLLGPQATAHLRLWREKSRQELRLGVKLGKWPVRNEEDIIATETRFPKWRGMTVDYPTARFKFLQRQFRYHKAVVVRDIVADSPAEAAGLQEGDFISRVKQTPVRTPEEFHKTARRLSGEVTLELASGRRVRVQP